jgi:hypothetical protein
VIDGKSTKYKRFVRVFRFKEIKIIWCFKGIRKRRYDQSWKNKWTISYLC